MEFSEEAYLAHYGIARRSGRYPWGSGGEEDGSTEVGRNKSFLDYVNVMRKEGMTETQIATAVGMTTTELRAARSIAKNVTKSADIAMAQRLKDKGWSNVAIGDRMGIPESTVRSFLKEGETEKLDILKTTSSMLKSQVDEKGFVDVGSGVENLVGVSRDKLNVAMAMLKQEGYEVHTFNITTALGNNTRMKVLGPPGSTQKEAWMARNEIRQIQEHSEDGGRTFLGMAPPLSIDSKRVGIRYAEEGGTDADGVIYVRPGVEDVSLGGSRYAQVRVAVDGSHYLKGMAIYKDDLPEGVDLLFNTNKSDTGNKLDALKPMKKDPNDESKVDPDNPFGSSIKPGGQLTTTVDGKQVATSVMNKVNEAGDWNDWSRNLSSQMLSKQSPSLAKTQLDMTFERKKNELEDILSLTNPVVKERLLRSYSDDVDAAAAHLKAAALPRQATKVILPVSSLKDNEIYAPTFRDGETVALVRFPHGGTFEIPELVVNNREPGAKKILGQATDAVGINARVAERLSGADFDGDSVLVIPNDSQKIRTQPALEALKGFDTKRSYPAVPGTSFSGNTQHLMGDVSNLITDMTIKGANSAELARAVRHSMVVIDAEKHNLNYKQSAIDNGIRQLKEKYQRRENGTAGGASTIVSRAGSDVRVLDRKARPASEGGAINRETGELEYVPTGRTIKTKSVDAYGNETITETPRQIKVKRLAEAKDAHSLITGVGTPMEKLYADHSNKLKALANQARLEVLKTTPTPYSPSAKAVYKPEVDRLMASLNVALRNRPLERQAQITANAFVSARRQANPGMDSDATKKLHTQALQEARLRIGAHKELIQIDDRQWEAIQAGAISPSKLKDILTNTDLDQIKQRAMPRIAPVMSPTKQARAKQMLGLGYTQAEIADALGVPVSTLTSSIKEGS